jgi:hypothetical protein
MIRNRHSAVFTTFALLTVVLLGGLASGVTPAWADTYHAYSNDNSGLCMGVSGSVQTNGGLIVQWNCNNGNLADKQWAITSSGQLKDLNSQKCLWSPNATQGTQLEQEDCMNVSSEEWSFNASSVSDGAVVIVSNWTHMCVGVKSASKTQGAPVVQWGCDGTSNQSWTKF